MPTTKTPYTKVKGFGMGKPILGIRKKLFETSNHLLLVENLGLREDYTRIQFQDIRYVAVFVKPKVIGRFIIGIVLSLLTTLLCVIYFGLYGLSAIIVCIGLLVVSWLRKNCVCAIGTDVQQILIPVPNTLPKVTPFIEYLRQRGAQLIPPIQ